jgi:hypothetical protein
MVFLPWFHLVRVEADAPIPIPRPLMFERELWIAPLLIDVDDFAQ